MRLEENSFDFNGLAGPGMKNAGFVCGLCAAEQFRFLLRRSDESGRMSGNGRES
jgi:hypothetical protein